MTRRPPLGRRGGLTAIAAVVAVAVVGLAGFALDLSRAWLVSARLKSAVDAAALIAARGMDDPDRDATARRLFWVNFSRNAATGGSYMGASISALDVTQLDTGRMQVTARAILSTTLFNVVSPRTMAVTETSVAQREANGIELALVLDQTASASGADAARLQAAQDGVGRLLSALYGTGDTQPDLSVAVVPFARSINIGTGSGALLNTAGMPPGWSANAWGGCVEARATAGHDLTDDPPVTPPSRFRPFFWQSTYRQVGTVRQGRCAEADSYPPQPGDRGERYCFGDNDWGAPQALLDLNPGYSALRGLGLGRSDAAGPNLLCAVAPLQSLQASRASVLQAVNALTLPATSGGASIVLGLQGAWYVLSPNWGGVWPNTAVAYGARGMRKVVVLLSSGANGWLPQNSFSPRVRATAQGDGAELFYGPYGRAANWNGARLTPPVTPGNRASGDAALDSRMLAVCQAMRDRGIRIFVIGLDVPSGAARGLLQGCASGANYYFESAGTAELESRFAEVGNALTNLRLSQ